MAVTQLPVGVKKQDLADLAWHTALNAGFDDLNTRLTLSGSATPEGSITGRWVGQRYFDTLRTAFWVFTGTPGNNTGWVREIAQGTVLMWSGAIGSIPTGWVLCDGVLHAPTGYTPPNLKGKFIAGYDAGDADYNAIGDTGGEKTHVLSVGEMPAHAHPGSFTGNAPAITADFVIQPSPPDSGIYASGGKGSLVTSQHSHPLTLASQGSGTAHENRPPFYTLAYIAKL